MAFIPSPQCANVQIIGSVDGQQTINNMYFLHSTPIAPGDLEVLADAVGTQYSAAVLPLLSDQFSLVAVRATDLTTQTGPQVTSSTGAGPGGTAGEPAPNNVSACISFRTNQRGRSFRGRNYIPAIPNSKIVTNTLDATWMTDMRTAYNGFIFGAGPIPTDWSMVVESRFSGGLPRTTAITSLVEFVVFVDNTVDSQRRRLPGRGR